jgi:hypothetical protein
MIEDTLIYEVLSRAARIPSDAEMFILAFNEDLKKEVIRLIQEDQLTAKGIDEAGTVIGYYSFMTEWITRGRKQEGDHYTLDDSGSFYRSMLVQVFGDGLEIDASSQTYSEMQGQSWWTDGILGLTDENLQRIIEMVKERHQKELNRILFEP